MRQTQKQKQRTKRAVEDVETSVPMASLSNTTEAAELVVAIDQLLQEASNVR
jgi:hypothetical protein